MEAIADNCEFSKMKKEKDPMENKAEWKDGQPGVFRKGMVYMYRKGLYRKYNLLHIK